ncbi:BON domain-containing protein [Paraburkholderia unamae]|uniref:BON domain-containing protein n=1 Tax=Paraburkholderia unamae TaxID=219649 RepID=A0ABX5K8S7_9BURK|nr:BON domain-containing protein [Paraburkholderia unamae]PVX70870.1 BON domain-containing protein [Paraburkholderia unamae]
MKPTHTGALAIGVLLAMMSLSALAQSTDAPASAPAGASMTAKQARAANRALQRRVVQALAKTRGVNATAIAVRADNGAVTLSGTVPEQGQMDVATSAAKAVPGVTSVRNALTLSTF